MAELLAVIGIALSVSFLCSILEAVLLSITHGYVEVMRERGEKAGELLGKMQRKIDEPISAILVLNTIANTFGAALSGALALQLFGNEWMAVFSAALTLAILLFSEILPKTLGATLWPRLAPMTAHVLRGMIVIMKPILVPLSFYTRLVTRGGKRPSTVSRKEIEVLARMGRKEGALDHDEWSVVTSVIKLHEVPVGEVMTPRTDIVAVPVGASVDKAMSVMLDTGHLRLPVYEENLDSMVGILLARDLWRSHRDGATSIREIMRPPRFAPTSKPVDDLIPEMKEQGVKMVIVVDEFGGTAGLATLEDLIEEIVGEIQDEHEEDEPEELLLLPSGDTRIWGGVPVRDVNNLLDLRLPEEPHDTIAGYVVRELNRIGRAGDVVDTESGKFTILRMRGRRIEYLLLSPKDVEEE